MTATFEFGVAGAGWVMPNHKGAASVWASRARPLSGNISERCVSKTPASEPCQL